MNILIGELADGIRSVLTQSKLGQETIATWMEEAAEQITGKRGACDNVNDPIVISEIRGNRKYQVAMLGFTVNALIEANDPVLLPGLRGTVGNFQESPNGQPQTVQWDDAD